MSLRLDWATHKAADYACKHWHYSRSMPRGKMVKIGVWEDHQFIGIVLFSLGANPNLVNSYGLKNTEGCELTRIALKRHKSEVSKIVSIALKFLKKSNPKLRLVVSFADTNRGHHGGIYQAGNWIYAGKSAKSVQYIDKKGKIWHNRNVSKTGYVKRFGGKYSKVPKPSECKVVSLEGKHRYLMPLDKKMRKQLESLAQPYPKRAKEAMAVSNGTAVVQLQPARSTISSHCDTKKSDSHH